MKEEGLEEPIAFMKITRSKLRLLWLLEVTRANSMWDICDKEMKVAGVGRKKRFFCMGYKKPSCALDEHLMAGKSSSLLNVPTFANLCPVITLNNCFTTSDFFPLISSSNNPLYFSFCSLYRHHHC